MSTPLLVLLSFVALGSFVDASEIRLIPTPDTGIQPVAEVDAAGNVHLVFFKGDAGHGDVFYAVRRKGESTFTEPVRVNSTLGSALGVGTIRGPQLALGRPGYVHVVWMGSSEVTPKGENHQTPMLYARSIDGGEHFDNERNVITEQYGLDGGGSVAADAEGQVNVFWHAGAVGSGEEGRKIWVARSIDDGSTFVPEVSAWDEATGACGCCGMTAGASAGSSWVLYRGAKGGVHRDIYLLHSTQAGDVFTGERLDQAEMPSCPMSAMSLSFAGEKTVAAWEAEGGDLAFAVVGTAVRGRVARGERVRKFPDVALSPDGHVLVTWVDGGGWSKKGIVAWQLFAPNGEPIGEVQLGGESAVWSKPAAVFDGEGFLVVH